MKRYVNYFPGETFPTFTRSSYYVLYYYSYRAIGRSKNLGGMSINLWMKVLVTKLSKSDNERSDVSLELRRLHYISCSINRFFINVLCSIIFKEAFIATIQVQSTSERRE